MGAQPIDLYFDLSVKQEEAWAILEESDQITELFYGGSAGPGKTTLGCAWKIYRRVEYPGTRGMIGRDQYCDLRDSTLHTFLKFWEQYGQYNVHGVTGRYREDTKTFYFSNGSQELFRHLAYEPSDPDYHRLGSLEISDLFVDELGECEEKAWDMAKSRIRYKLDVFPVKKPKALGCGNPIRNWVRTRFIKDKSGNIVNLRDYQAVVRALLTDNPNKAFRDLYAEQLRTLSEYDQMRLLDGDWDAEERTGGEFYHAYEAYRHKRPTPFIPGLPVLHMTLDQNTLPYYTCLLFQVLTDAPDGRTKLRFFDEVCLAPPNATTKAICQEVKRRYGHLVDTIFFYGDSSGNKEDTRNNKSDYAILKSELAEYMTPISNRVNKSNQSVRFRGEFVNDLLEGKYDVDLEIDPRCINLLNDMAKCKVDENGGKLKSKVKDKKTKQTYEEVAHAGDALEYGLIAVLKSLWERFKAGKAALKNTPSDN